MPEISGQGQRKLLESKACIYGENVKEIMPLVLYLSAMGIGNIYCSIKDESTCNELFSNVMDLNDDIKIELIKDKIVEPDFRIVLGSCIFIKETVKAFVGKFTPTILATYNQWKAILRVFIESHELYNFIQLLNNDQENNLTVPFIWALVGSISSIEGVKLCLNIGSISKDILMIDMLNMVVDYYNNEESPKAVNCLVKTENFNYVSIEEKLSHSKILIIGAGGLGSPSSLALTMAGIGTIGLVDSDCVEVSNLNRQILHSISRIGMPKAESAKYFLKKVNPQLTVNTYIENLNKENVNSIIGSYDLVISAVDNIQTRYLINDACYFANKPVIEAGVLRFDGTNTTIIPKEGHCYRCLYPSLSASGMSCAETGVLGSVPGVMGFIQAAEAYKILTGIGTVLMNKILLYDGLEMEFNVIDLERNPQCPICGKEPTITKLQDYTLKCSDD